jgi:hypothetical protein
MLQFGGWNITHPSFDCTLNELPCEYSLEDMPGHINLYNQEQIEFVLRKTQHIFDVFGYVLDRSTSIPRLRLVQPQIPMCLGQVG